MISNEYLYSSVYSKYNDFIPEEKSIYLYGNSIEDRSLCPDRMKIRNREKVQFVKVIDNGNDFINIEGIENSININDFFEIGRLINGYNSEIVYIDVTGLNTRICASFIKQVVNMIYQKVLRQLYIVYFEPQKYSIDVFKSEGVYNDLADKIEGISPLPGFSAIIPVDQGDTYFFAFLGFEGGRFSYLLEKVQPVQEKIYPIIGTPGYRIEYPYYTYLGNKRAIRETECWKRRFYIAANSIVESYEMITSKCLKDERRLFRIAPIGTKPHAIGVILSALKHPNQIEIIFDNPKKIKKRTTGYGNIVVTNATKLME
jgi:hypothetical protein